MGNKIAKTSGFEKPVEFPGQEDGKEDDEQVVRHGDNVGPSGRVKSTAILPCLTIIELPTANYGWTLAQPTAEQLVLAGVLTLILIGGLERAT